MTLSPLLILPLVGGYFLFSTWRRTHYYGAREEGHKLYFRSAFYGTFLAIFSSLIHITMFCYLGWYRDIVGLLASMLNVPSENGMWQDPALALVLVMSVFWGSMLGHVFNLPSYAERWTWLAEPMRSFFQNWAHQVLTTAYARKGSDLERLVLSSQEESLPIMVTLEIGKVYVGWPLGNVHPGEERKTLRIMPILSGYRDESQQVQFTTDYSDVVESIKIQANVNSPRIGNILFEVILNAEQIVSSRLFDANVYAKNFDPDRQADATESELRDTGHPQAGTRI